MSTTSAYLTVRGIDVDVVYKDIKNLHIGVYPPMGRVRVAAPLTPRRRPGAPRGRAAPAVDQAATRSNSRPQNASPNERWSQASRTTSGGSDYRLKVIERPGRAHIEIDGDRLLLYVARGHDQPRSGVICSTAGTATQLRPKHPGRHREVGADHRRGQCPGGASVA